MEDKEIIDFVLPWVDGGDKEWQNERAKYSENRSFNEAAYRDWGILKYWFRSVEKYAPWVNKIYFVTCGHLPEWLDTSNPKLVIVNHKEFIPEEYLPTFSANPIELNIHRIKGLSNKFVFFNDDVFLNNKTSKEDYFVNGLPCDMALLNVHCPNRAEAIYDIQINNVRVINSYFDMKKILKDNKRDWFNFKYGIKANMQNLVFSKCNRFPGFQPLHVCNSYLKDTYEDLWNKEFDVLDATCKRKFRTHEDVNQYLMKDWQLVNSKFVPYSKQKVSKVVYFGFKSLKEEKEDISKSLNSKGLKFFCINDGNLNDNYEEVKNYVTSLLEQKFPEKSGFEK